MGLWVHDLCFAHRHLTCHIWKYVFFTLYYEMHGNRGRVMNKVDVWYVEEEWMGCMEENVCSMLGETYTCGLGRRSMSMISLIFFRLKWNVQIWFKYFMEQMDVYGGRNRPISLTSSSVNTSAMGGWVFSITSSWICWKFDKFQWCCSQIYFFFV